MGTPGNGLRLRLQQSRRRSLPPGNSAPVAAEGFDQADQSDAALALELNDSSFLSQRCALGGGDFEVGHQAGFVAVIGDFKGVPGGSEGGVFGVEFGSQEVVGGELVLDFLEGSEHGLAIIGDGFIVSAAGEVELGAVATAGEQGQVERRSDGPETAGPIEEGSGVERLEPGEAIKDDARIEGAGGDADVSIGGGHAPFGGGDVGASFKEFARQAGGDGRNGLGARRGGGELKTRSGLATEHGQSMNEIYTLEIDGGHLGLGATQLSFGFGNIQVRGNAALAAVAGQIERTPIGLDGITEQDAFGLQGAEGEII